MSRYLDPKFAALKPYTPGEQPVQTDRLIKLNTNESPFPPSPKVQKAAKIETECLQLYPDPGAGELLAALGDYFGVPQQQVYAGNGSDEVLAFIFQALCPCGVAFADITYGFYPVYAQLYGLNAKIIPLDDQLRICKEDYFGLERTIVLANPNAPTGIALRLEDMEAILQANAGHLVVVDEAYVHFGAQSCVSLLPRYDNLLVVGTFSKYHGLAGARLGYAVGSEALIADLNHIKYSFNPYNLNRMTLAAGAAAARDVAYYRTCGEKIIRTREWCKNRLQAAGYHCTDSVTNFLFVRHPALSGRALYAGLREKNILVRWWDAPRIQDYVRITIGTDEEMQTTVGVLQQLAVPADA